MAQVVDLWHKKDKKTRTAQYGKGRRWQAIYIDPEGNRKRPMFRTRDEAEAALAENVTAVNAGTYVTKEQKLLTFGDLWPRLEKIKSTKAKKTQEMYAGTWNGYIKGKWQHARVREVRAPAVREWIAGLHTAYGDPRPISESYEHKILLTMRSMLRLAVEDGALHKNPLDDVQARSQPVSSRRYLEVAQADALLLAIRPHHLMVETMLLTGIRRGEAAGLKVQDLNVRRARLRIERDIDEEGNDDSTKSKRHRDVPVSGELLASLLVASHGKKRNEYLMPDLKGKPWTKHTWRPVWEKVRAKSGIPDLDTQELRHTAVSWAIHSGANVKTIQRMVGHASAAMTLDVYGHLWDDQLDEVSKKVARYVARERAITRAAAKKTAAEAGRPKPDCQ